MESDLPNQKADRMIVAALDPQRLEKISSSHEEITDVRTGKAPVPLGRNEQKAFERIHNPFLAPRDELKARANTIAPPRWMREPTPRRAKANSELKYAAFGGSSGGRNALKDVAPEAYREKVLEDLADWAAALGFDSEAYYAKVRTRLRRRKERAEGIPAKLIPPGPPPPERLADAGLDILERVARMAYRDLARARGR